MPEDLFAWLYGDERADGGSDGGSIGSRGAEAIAAAITANLADHDPAVACAVQELLTRQTRILDAQMASAEEDRRLRLRDDGLRRWAQRFRLTILILIAVLLFSVAIIVGWTIVDAIISPSVVVESFDTPSAMSGRGLTGDVVATDLLDKLTQLQVASRANVKKWHLTNAWTGRIKFEVPETNISIDEIGQLLKERFGHDIHIQGDVVEDAAGKLTLTVRGDGVLPKAFSGSNDLQTLNTKAAEYIFGQLEPALYATYLQEHGRTSDAIEASISGYASASRDQRAYLLNTWATSLDGSPTSLQKSLWLERRSLEEKPDYWDAYNNIMNDRIAIGDEEGAWQTGETLRQKSGGRPGRAPEVDYFNEDLLTWNLDVARKALLADEALSQGIGTGTTADAPMLADIDVRQHNAQDAEFQLETVGDDPDDPTIPAIKHFAWGRLYQEAGDKQLAAREMDAFLLAFSNPLVSTQFPNYPCWAAPVEEAVGRQRQADDLLEKGGHFVECYRFKGDILDGRGRWPDARNAYAEAIAAAPDLPAGYYSLGLALARHGDLAGALDNLKAAIQRGPHWADPLKAWGDILGAQGRWDEALAKYRQALAYAPNWVELLQARDRAAARGGRP